MAALKRLTHGSGVAYAFEGVIDTAIGQLDDVIDDICNFIRIHEIGHAELARHCDASGIDVDPDDLVGTDHLRCLNHVQTNAAQSEHDHIRTGFHLGRKNHGADTGCDTATDVACLVEGRI